MLKIPRIEQETVITYNAQEDFAEVYTCYPPMIRKLDKLAQKNPEEWKILRGDQIGKTYTCPKSLITLRSKSAPKKELTEEEKQKARERMKKANPYMI